MCVLNDNSLFVFNYRECNKILENRNWEKDVHKVHFESGVRMGVGAFNLVWMIWVFQEHKVNWGNSVYMFLEQTLIKEISVKLDILDFICLTF